MNPSSQPASNSVLVWLKEQRSLREKATNRQIPASLWRTFRGPVFLLIALSVLAIISLFVGKDIRVYIAIAASVTFILILGWVLIIYFIVGSKTIFPQFFMPIATRFEQLVALEKQINDLLPQLKSKFSYEERQNAYLALKLKNLLEDTASGFFVGSLEQLGVVGLLLAAFLGVPQIILATTEIQKLLKDTPVTSSSSQLITVLIYGFIAILTIYSTIIATKLGRIGMIFEEKILERSLENLDSNEKTTP
jgi:hypothetical protein